MSVVAEHNLPISETLSPADAAAVCEVVREAHASGSAVYPIGGGSSLSYGRPAVREGLGLSLRAMKQLIDYPARDMTITIEAGMSLASLQETLAAENQQLPVDLPHANDATIGGLLATNWNGSRRLGYGSLRDYVIGIEAVDGQGMLYHGGGRVVKNVAGYDFCKLLTGSLGTLGVITQVTLKLRPIAPQRMTLACQVGDMTRAEQLLASLGESSLRPVAVNLSTNESGSELAVTFEGTQAEVAWQMETLTALWKTLAVQGPRELDSEAATRLLQQAADFPANATSAVVLKANVVPSGVAPLIAAAQQAAPSSEALAHAASGIVFIRLPEEPDDLGKLLQSTLRPLASKYHGHVIVVRRSAGSEMTPHMVWGGLGESLGWMHAVKQQFDPAGILNPGRFVF